jgi:hypothetical protein
MNVTGITPETVKKLNSKKWRLTHLYKIIGKNPTTGGMLKQTFSPNRVQRRFLNSKHNRNILCKARQMGFTTLACIDMLDDCLFNNDFNAVIIAHDEKSMRKIFKKILYAWDNWPFKNRGWRTINKTTTELHFSNGSTISVALSSRSDTVHRLHISEFGKICRKYPDKAQEILTGAIPSVPPGGRIDIESTAEGEDGAFYEMYWLAAERNGEPQEAQWKAHFFPWFLCADYVTKARYELPRELREAQVKYQLSDDQINWYYGEKTNNLKHLMSQEHPFTQEEAFMSSGDKVFDVDVLKLYSERIEVGEKVGDWTYYEPYKPNHSYALGADVSEGIGKDSSTCAIIDFTLPKPKVVAVYRNNRIAPDIFAHEVMKGATRYGSCLVAVERNNHGHTTLSKLNEMYANLYREYTRDKVTNLETERLGWLSTSASKPKIIFGLKEAVEEFLIDITDSGAIRELRTYDQEDLRRNRFDPESTRHFDVAQAIAICYEMRYHVDRNVADDTIARMERVMKEIDFNPHKVV